MEIEIYSDVVCPWCYLGAARLQAAAANLDHRAGADVEAVLRWRAFQLDPDGPRPGRPLIEWLGRRFGGTAPARQAMARVTALASAEGLHLDFERAVIANSFDAHRLLWFADQPQAVAFGATAETQPQLAWALHEAHFRAGLDISSHDVLVDIAATHGLDPQRVRRLLATTEGTPEVRGEIARAYDLGITSVPTFIFAGKYAVTGAQETATLSSAMIEVARRQREGHTGATVPGQRGAPTTDDRVA